jgi:hypothetical protein
MRVQKYKNFIEKKPFGAQKKAKDSKFIQKKNFKA